MALYTETVMDHFMHPRNVGEIADADGVGEVGNAKCGDIMKMYLKIKDNRIEDVKFETFGCGSAIASSSIATEMIKGQHARRGAGADQSRRSSTRSAVCPRTSSTAPCWPRRPSSPPIQDYYDKNDIAYDHSKFPKKEDCESCCRMV